MKRHHNHGLRKICGCPSRLWPKCDHGWHLNFKHAGTHYRFSLDRHAGRHLTSKAEALAEADVLRTAVRAGNFGRSMPAPQTVTLDHIGRLYFDRYMKVGVVEKPLHVVFGHTATSPPRRGISPRHGGGCIKYSDNTSSAERRKLEKVASSLQERRDLPYL